jgi:hypothetical protein
MLEEEEEQQQQEEEKQRGRLVAQGKGSCWVFLCNAVAFWVVLVLFDSALLGKGLSPELVVCTLEMIKMGLRKPFCVLVGFHSWRWRFPAARNTQFDFCFGVVVFVASGGGRGGDDGNGDEEAELLGGEKRRRRRTATRTWKQQQEGRRIQGFCGMKKKWGLQEEEAISSAMERRSLQKVHVLRCSSSSVVVGGWMGGWLCFGLLLAGAHDWERVARVMASSGCDSSEARNKGSGIRGACERRWQWKEAEGDDICGQRSGWLAGIL